MNVRAFYAKWLVYCLRSDGYIYVREYRSWFKAV